VTGLVGRGRRQLPLLRQRRDSLRRRLGPAIGDQEVADRDCPRDRIPLPAGARVHRRRWRRQNCPLAARALKVRGSRLSTP